MSDFESEVMRSLGVLEERTKGLPKLQSDVESVKGRVKLLEFKAGLFGSMAGAIVVSIKYLLSGRH